MHNVKVITQEITHSMLKLRVQYQDNELPKQVFHKLPNYNGVTIFMVCILEKNEKFL